MSLPYLDATDDLFRLSTLHLTQLDAFFTETVLSSSVCILNMWTELKSLIQDDVNSLKSLYAVSSGILMY